MPDTVTVEIFGRTVTGEVYDWFWEANVTTGPIKIFRVNVDGSTYRVPETEVIWDGG